MNPSMIEILGTALFGIAVVHTFSIKFFQHIALKFPDGSIGENFFHLLGEVEIVFGLWAGVLVVGVLILMGTDEAVRVVDSSNFTEPAFVFAIMAVAATRPVVEFSSTAISWISRLIPLKGELPFFISALIIGPLLGSFITEPAAMTVTALILRDRFFNRNLPDRFMYLTLGVLFVNISIGGVLTPFAAPPVLMVAATWKFDLAYMLHNFGWKAAIGTTVNALLVAGIFSARLKRLKPVNTSSRKNTPAWLQFVHLGFMAMIVLAAHHASLFLGIFLFFLGVTAITKEYQEEIRLKESLLVGFFLAGLVVLGGQQRWWLAPLIGNLDASALFFGTAALTAITDNAALTYLGSRIPDVSDAFKYALTAGAITGGGLTVIANAPNPAGFAILRDSFGPEGISPGRLFLGALGPTVVAAVCMWFL